MNGRRQNHAETGNHVSDSDEGDTWAPLPPGDDDSDDANEAPSKDMGWDHLLEDSSHASDVGMPGVALSARALSVRSRYELAMGVDAGQLLEVEPEPSKHTTPELARMASRTAQEPLLKDQKAEASISPERSEPDGTDLDTDGDLGGFHNPDSASPTQTRSSHDSDDDRTEADDTADDRSEHSVGRDRAHGAAANATHHRRPHYPSHRRGSNVSLAESIRSVHSRASVVTGNTRGSQQRRLRPVSMGKAGAESFNRVQSGGTRASTPPPDEDATEATLLQICRRGHHKEADVVRVGSLLEDRTVARKPDENGKTPVHLLCEAPAHTEKSVEILTLILKAHKSGAKQAVANVRTNGLLPIHLLCSNRQVTEQSEALLRVLMHAYEDAVEMSGGKDAQIPIVMLCRNRKFTRGTFLMLKRLVEAHKESVKEKNAEGRTLLHELCSSSAAYPHTEHSVEAVRVILEAYKRGPEIPDNQGLRPLHSLCLSEQLTTHSVSICKMLLEKYEPAAALQDEQGMLAVHHLCGRERLSDYSLEICRKVLEVFEKGAQVKDAQGRIALHLICASGVLSKISVDMTRQLLLAHKQAYAVADVKGRLPLHVLLCAMTPEREGAEFGEQIQDLLLWTDQEAVKTQDSVGWFPLHALCASGLFREAELSMLHKLLAAPQGQEAAGTPDNDGNIPLHLLCGSKPHTVYTSEAYKRLSQVLAELPPPEDAPRLEGAKVAGHGGKLAVHCLCEAGEHTAQSVEMFEWLHEENPHGIGYKDAAGMTPLHWLCSAWGHTEYSAAIFDKLVASLQAKGSQMADIRTAGGLLPVHILCGAGKHTEHSFEIFKKLMEAHTESVQIRTNVAQVSLNSVNPVLMQNQGKRDQDETETADHTAADEEQHESHIPLGRVPLHFLCGSDEHTSYSVEICKTLLELYREGVTIEDQEDLQPLHLLCTSPRLTSHSTEISRLVVEQIEKHMLEELNEMQLVGEEPQAEADWRPLLYVCSSSTLSEHSVNLCRLLLDSQSRQNSRRNISGMDRAGSLSTKWNPLHDLCLTSGHTSHSVQICEQLLVDHKDWAKDTGEQGKLPLHVLCECEGHTECSLEMCRQLLDANPDAIEVPDASSGCLPIHLLSANPTLTSASTKISERLLTGRGAKTPKTVCDRGWTPLHHLCAREIKSPSDVLLARQLLHVYPNAATVKPADDNPKSRDMNLPLHTLCRAERHTTFSVEVCKHLIAAHPDAISEAGNQIADDTMYDEEDLEGDVPLMMVVKGEKLNANSARLAAMLVEDGDDLPDTLNKLAQKVYRPKGDEIQQRMALRIMIVLAFLEPDSVISFFHLDESQSGAHSISFMKEVVDELGFDAENPLHHVLRAGQLYKTLSEHETASVLVARLSKLSEVHVEWAADIVEGLSGKVAKRAIWTPEKESDEFMVGDSPIGIALELGDLKIVSHGAVFDVVKEAWPGEYKYQYNPFSGSMYNNLILEYSQSLRTGNKDTKAGGRQFKWMWEKRILELANPEMLNTSPMMMYWLGIFFQTSFLCVFHIVVESSSFANDYPWSLGPASWYLILHVSGGILFEAGQMVGDGLVGYSQDPWNVVDVSMYSLLTVWLVFRVADSIEAHAQGAAEFVPETSVSSEFLGLAAIFIWLRMLNVFGLDQNFGPLVRIIQGMVNNVFAFMVLLTVFLAGFATSLMLIFKRMDPDSPEFEDSEFPFDSFGDQQVAMLSLLDMALGQFELLSVFEVSTLAFWVTFFFLAATFIMLFNLLIALMTDTYATIRETSEQLWKKDRALLMASYTKTEKMSEKVNLGGILTALPQPLNLLVVAAMIILTPFYLLIKMRNNTKGKGWQKLVNQLQARVIDALLFLIVCLPFCLVFIFIILPLNWLFVASSGLLEYLGLELKSIPSFLKSLISQALGVVFCPVIFALALIVTPVYLAHREISKLCTRNADVDPDSTHDMSIRRIPSEAPSNAPEKQKRGSIFGNIGHMGMAFRGSLVSDSGQGESQAPSSREITAGGDKSVLVEDQKTGRLGLEKVWEQNLDEDDISALKAAHRSTMPIDNTGEDDEAEVLVNEEDAALQEVRNELSKRMVALDGNQRTLLQTTRDLQIESKTAQQETATSITKLESKVGDMAKDSTAVAKAYEEKLESLKLETDDKINRVAELLFYQAEAQQAAFKLQDQKINLLLQSMGYDEAETLNMSIPHTPFPRTNSANFFAVSSPTATTPRPAPTTPRPVEPPVTKAIPEGEEQAARAGGAERVQEGADKEGREAPAKGEVSATGGGGGEEPAAQGAAATKSEDQGEPGQGQGEPGQGQGQGEPGQGQGQGEPGQGQGQGEPGQGQGQGEPGQGQGQGERGQGERGQGEPGQAKGQGQGEAAGEEEQAQAQAAAEAKERSAPVTAPSLAAAQAADPPPAVAPPPAEALEPPSAAATAPPPASADAVPADDGDKMPPKEEPKQVPSAHPKLDLPETPQDPAKAPPAAPPSGGSFKGTIDRLFGKLKAAHQGTQQHDHVDHHHHPHQQSTAKKLAAKPKKPALQALEEHMTESQLQSKKQMESLSEQILSLAPSLDMLKKVLEVQDSSTTMVQRLQEKLSSMEPALAQLDQRLEKAEKAAAASSGELKGSLASLNPQIRALEAHLSNKQQESSSAIMKAVEERVSAVSVKSEQGTKELLRAWELKVEAIQKNTDQSKQQLQRVVEERLMGLTQHVEKKNSELLKVVEDKVERTVAQSSAAVERQMTEQGQQFEQQMQRMGAQQSEEMREQITTLDDRMVEEITRMDARVKAEVKDMTQRSTERMESQMGTVMETLEQKISDTYDQLKDEHSTQINTIHAAISRIPAPPPPVEPTVDPGPRFTWADHLGTGDRSGRSTRR